MRKVADGPLTLSVGDIFGERFIYLAKNAFVLSIWVAYLVFSENKLENSVRP